MLYAVLALFVLQWVGEVLVQLLGLPLPGALVGALLLLVGLLALGRLPRELEQTAGALLQNMMLLFIPIVAGVMLHFERIASEWLPFIASGIGGAVLTLVVTALVFRHMLARTGQQAQAGTDTPEQP
ncbi:CidA/LrgA family protein [Comamonas nitrativorans]|uniref:CidA/LrgA family protein n=1 Tax=Comamonas nitrativorans TaxID=108437 RepID=A0ABV9H1B7_9BURK